MLCALFPRGDEQHFRLLPSCTVVGNLDLASACRAKACKRDAEAWRRRRRDAGIGLGRPLVSQHFLGRSKLPGGYPGKVAVRT